MHLTRKQSKLCIDILSNPAYRRVLVDGGARSAKTVAIVTWLIKAAWEIPGLRILMARKTRISARNTLYDYTIPMVLQDAQGFRKYDSDMLIECPGGSLIRVDGLDDKDRVDRILGDEYGIEFFNEATQLSWGTVRTVLTRLSQSVPGLPVRKAIFDCNPKSTRHWLYRVGVMRQDPDNGQPLKDAETWARMSFSPYDNPFLEKDYLETLDALTGVQRRRMLLGEWCDNEGAVYDEFDESIHVIDEMPHGWQRWQFIRGVDFGYTNPFVRLCGAVDNDGRLYIFREHYQSKMIVRDHAALINEQDREAYDWTIADHDAEDRATLHAEGIYTLPAEKGILPGINAVKARLRPAGDGLPRLFFLKPCVNSISEMIGYAWPQSVEGRSEKEAPVKENDHCPDVVRYMVAKLDGLGTSWGPSGAA
jgi:PBSX family phage terminase large subunit